MELEIEAASIENLSRFHEIEKQCFSKEAFTKQQIAYLLTDYNSVGFEARISTEVVGFVLGRVDLDRNMPFGHIITLDVTPSYRRNGLAQRLLEKIEAIFREKGVSEYRLEVRENNFPALNLYQKLGYYQVGKIEGYYGNADGLYLKKNLE